LTKSKSKQKHKKHKNICSGQIFQNQNFYQCEEANCQTETRHQQIPRRNADKI